MRLLIRFKIIVRLLALIATTIGAGAQSTIVSITAVDSNSQVWSKGTITYLFQGNTNFHGSYQWQGNDIPSQYLVPNTVSLDNNGYASFTLPDSSSISPALSSWQFTICPNASVQCAIVVIPTYGAAEDISNTVNPQLTPISVAAAPFPKAYQDSEVKVVPSTGGIYYNTSNNITRQWNGSSWSNIAGNNPTYPIYNIDPTSPVSLTTQMANLFTSCGNTCTVYIPCGIYNITSGTINVNYPGLSIEGAGRNCVVINYAGLNFLDWRLTSSTYTINPAGSIGGFTINCTNPAALCLTGGSSVGAVWHDLTVIGPGGITNSGSVGTSECFVFQNTYDWMERWSLENSQVSGCKVNIHFKAPTGAGTNSYGYGLVKGLWTNQGVGTYGTEIDAGADVYNLLGWSSQFNAAGTTTADEVFRVAGTMTGEGFHVVGENTGAPITFAHILTSGNMQLEGDYLVFGGGVITDATTVAEGLPPFWIMPKAGLNGIAASVAGAGTISSYGMGTAVAGVTVVPSEIYSPSNPSAVATRGYVQIMGDNYTSPYVAYDPHVPLCDNVRPIYSANNALTPTRCLDGSGNEMLLGQLTAAKINSTSTVQIKGLDVLMQNETNSIADGDVVLASGVGVDGIFQIYFNGPNRVHEMVVAVSAHQFNGTASINILSQLVYNFQPVISNLRIVRDSSNSPQLVATLSNRNGGTNLIVTLHTGSNIGTLLLPSVPVGTTVTPNVNPSTFTSSFISTAASTDTISLPGMVSTGHCSSPAPTNTLAATNITGTFISAKTTDQITVTHTASSGMAYDVTCTNY